MTKFSLHKIVILIVFFIGSSLYAKTIVEEDSFFNSEESAQVRLIHPFFTDFVYDGNKLDAKLNKISLLPVSPNYNTINLLQTSPFHNFKDSLTQALRNRAKQTVVRKDMRLITYHISDLPSPKQERATLITSKLITKILVADSLQLADNTKIRTLTPLEIKKKNWVGKGRALLQLSQNYVSPNWHKGGESNFNLLGIFFYEYNYVNDKNIQFENNVDVKAGISSNPENSLRMFSVNSNLLKGTSKFGYKAIKNLYYTASAEFSTQILNGYKSLNDNERITSFLSPARFYFSVGMDYKPHKNFSLFFSPATYKFIGVIDTANINQTQYGIPADRKLKNEFGNVLRTNYKRAITKEIQAETTFGLYTNYDKLEVDWETIANFIINRYMSARISVYLRYDNSALSTTETPKIQLNEIISIGFSHRF
jgi:hypothetical protein